MTPTDVNQRPVLRPGDIYWVEIHPAETRGEEIFKTRPFVVVSRYRVNEVVETIVGVPLSLGALASDSRPFRIFIPKEEIIGAREAKDCIAKCDAVRQVSVTERVKQKYGALSASALTSVGGGLAFLFDLR